MTASDTDSPLLTPRLRPPFEESHEHLRANIRAFVEREIAPYADAWEEARWFPDDLFARCGEHGLFGLKFESEYGGGEAGYLAAAVLCEELQRCGSGGVAANLALHSEIALPPVWRFGDEDQRQRFLTPGIRGEKIAALGISEPGAGSDVAAISTRAERVDDGYLLNGRKRFIGNGVRADFIVCAVRTGQQGGNDGISLMVVEPGEGVEARRLEKMGWHAADTAEITLTDVFVPDANLLGEEGSGFPLIMENFQWERLWLSLEAVGRMQYWLERTVKYARERTAFGEPIGSHQAVRHMLADSYTALEAARALTYEALRLFVADEDSVAEVTMAKLFSQRAACDTLDDCLQVHGGAGYLAEYGIERAFRDARVGPIGGGTEQIMREIIGRQLGL